MQIKEIGKRRIIVRRKQALGGHRRNEWGNGGEQSGHGQRKEG